MKCTITSLETSCYISGANDGDDVELNLYVDEMCPSGGWGCYSFSSFVSKIR